MIKQIFVTGLCTLHWGRLQYGNVGNYYIVEPFFRLLHKYYPEAEIVTTFQMDEGFIQRENIKVMPMNLYYSWHEDDVYNVEKDVRIASQYIKKDSDVKLTPYLECVNDSDLIVNISGDMWGVNAEHVGHDRFYVDCLKMKAAQLLNKRTILYAVTPGPFTAESYSLALDVFSHFDLVVIRERVSFGNLKKWGFPFDHVVWAPCPSFLFEINNNYKSKWIDLINNSEKKVVGITFGGFNMPVGPYDMWPRADWQFGVFVKLAEHIINDLNCKICIFSHTNGFNLPPNFKLINGRDFVILKKFYELLIDKDENYKDEIILIDEPLLPVDLKTVIGKLDMLVTGRVHASVAATSQYVPTVFVEYDRRVVYSDKMFGFSQQLGLEEYVCMPNEYEKVQDCVDKCFAQLAQIKKHLKNKMLEIKIKSENAVKEFSHDI